MAFFNETNNNENSNNVNNHNMAFDFNMIEVNDDVSGITSEEKLFSQKCDALMFTGKQSMSYQEVCKNLRKDHGLLSEYRYLERKGYFEAGFYMLHPFYYLGLDYDPVSSVLSNNTVFIRIGDNTDLTNLHRKVIFSGLSSDQLENLPIVVFCNYSGKICIKDTDVDLSKRYNCWKDCYEFIGVYKATAIGEDKYNLTKIFDRYYFDIVEPKKDC